LRERLFVARTRYAPHPCDKHQIGFKRRAMKVGQSASAIICAEAIRLSVLPGKQPLCKRAVGQDADAKFFAARNDL
jgi:hypothetical protein